MGVKRVLASTWLALAALAALAPGCGNDGPTPSRHTGAGGTASSQLPGIFEGCTPGKACEDGLDCVDAGYGYRCQHLCQSDADCNFTIKVPVEEVTAVCGTLAPGLQACTEPCDFTPLSGPVCMDGHPVACSALDETSCSTCGCPTNLRCEPAVGCQPKRNLDDECRLNSDCVSNNCDPYAKVCRVPVGSACTASNCQICVASARGTYCSRTCGSEFECNGGACMFQECSPLCAGPVDRNCLGECRVTYHPGGGSPDIYGCLCDPMACRTLSPPPGVGSPCQDTEDCGADGACLVLHPPGDGHCSKHCEQNPCLAGQSCVNIPCGAGETNTCGSLCLVDCDDAEPRCRSGSCRSLMTAEAQAVEVCDYRRPGGTFCKTSGDCQSGLCLDTQCTPAP